MRLKCIFATDACDFGASIPRGVILVGEILTVVPTPPSGCQRRHTSCRATQLVSVMICAGGLHAGSKFGVALVVPPPELSAICRVATLRRRFS